MSHTTELLAGAIPEQNLFRLQVLRAMLDSTKEANAWKYVDRPQSF